MMNSCLSRYCDPDIPEKAFSFSGLFPVNIDGVAIWVSFPTFSETNNIDELVKTEN